MFDSHPVTAFVPQTPQLGRNLSEKSPLVRSGRFRSTYANIPALVRCSARLLPHGRWTRSHFFFLFDLSYLRALHKGLGRWTAYEGDLRRCGPRRCGWRDAGQHPGPVRSTTGWLRSGGFAGVCCFHGRRNVLDRGSKLTAYSYRRCSSCRFGSANWRAIDPPQSTTVLQLTGSRQGELFPISDFNAEHAT